MLNILRKQAAKYLLSQQNKPQRLSDLKYAFVDSEGMRYYTWSNLSEITPSRYTALAEMIMYSDAKIAPDTLLAISEEIDKANYSLINEKAQPARNKFHAQISVLTNEL